MRKLLYICLILISAFMISACQEDEEPIPTVITPVDLTVTIDDETVLNNHITVNFSVNYTFDSIDDLSSVIDIVAADVYQAYFDEIDGNLYYLTINAHNNSFLLGYKLFQINASIDQPGLKTLEFLVSVE